MSQQFAFIKKIDGLFHVDLVSGNGSRRVDGRFEPEADLQVLKSKIEETVWSWYDSTVIFLES